jgi:uncharacterized protein (DUF1697 family)
MKEKQYLALLRGINVGGNNIIKMTKLKASFEDMGFRKVITYIQSGNVLFDSPPQTEKALENKIEKELSKKFKYKSCVLVISNDKMAQIIKEAPKHFGKNPDKYRYDIIFIKNPLTPKKAMNAIETKEGVDTANLGKHALYFSRLISKTTQSKLSKIIQKPEYKNMTIRNWNTATKLLAIINK